MMRLTRIGFARPPIRNSVILVEGQRIKAVGTVGTIAIPSGTEVISTEGMSVLPGLWDMQVHLMITGHSDYAHLGSNIPCPVRARDHAGVDDFEHTGWRRHRSIRPT